MNRLSQIQSTAAKIEAKREMIGKHLPWIEGAMTAEAAGQDEIEDNMTAWAIDTDQCDLAFRLSQHILPHDLALPERSKRKPATIIAEQVAEARLAPALTITRDWLQRFDALLEGHDIFD